MSVGERVRKVRLRRKMAQKILAEKTGIHQSELSRIEHALRDPTVPQLRTLAAVLGVSPRSLL